MNHFLYLSISRGQYFIFKYDEKTQQQEVEEVRQFILTSHQRFIGVYSGCEQITSVQSALQCSEKGTPL